jgi:pimeloyl-ACP methyl ester carboxylesterase
VEELMAYAQSGSVRLHYEDVGSGDTIIFVHEFGSDSREWEAQLRWFSREYRCIAFNARGYPPSDVPTEASAYGHIPAADDIAAVINHIGTGPAHVVGLSMGAYASLLFGIRYPHLARSLVVAGCGSGAANAHRQSFKQHAEQMAQEFLEKGSAVAANNLGLGATRIQLQNKDPRSWQEFVDHLSQHSAQGSAMTLRHYQAERPSLYDFEDELKSMTIPVLLAVGDEDEPCLDINLYLKRTIHSSGLWIAPRTGHAINLEEPAAFNAAVQAFLSSVERGRWGLRDPRSLVVGLANPGLQSRKV